MHRPSDTNSTPGQRLREAIATEAPLQLPGVPNALIAMLAETAGFRAAYVSGGGVAANRGLPDLGIITREDVHDEVQRITAVSSLPLLVDVDTGFGGPRDIARTILSMISAGAAGVHLEDQVEAKRCGHRPNKSIVSTQTMVDRLHAAVDAKTDPDFVVMARTDALANEGLAATKERIHRYVEAGADAIFVEAVPDLDTFGEVVPMAGVPVLANLTEFGRTPMFTIDELRTVGVHMALYPLSAFRAMNQAAASALRAIREDGTQAAVVERMQTRQELYDLLDYESRERELDARQLAGGGQR